MVTAKRGAFTRERATETRRVHLGITVSDSLDSQQGLSLGGRGIWRIQQATIETAAGQSAA